MAKSRVAVDRYYPSEYSQCPGCGKLKAASSSLCYACRYPRAILAQPTDRSIRHLPLTQGYFAVISADAYDRVVAVSDHWSADIQRRKDGSIKNVYGQCQVQKNGKVTKYKLHRVILGVTDPDIEVDHRDHNGLNCRDENLRTATSAQNTYNSRKGTLNTSGYKGVWWRAQRNKWISVLRKDGRSIYLGCWERGEIEKAARAYDDAAIRYFGDRACLNFPQSMGEAQ